MTESTSRDVTLFGILLLALGVRLEFAHIANDIIDVRNFQRVAETVSHNGILALYTQTAGQYPYPPLWVWFELAAYWLSRHGILNFSWLIRLPSILADLGILFVCWQWWHPHRTGHDWKVALLYALSPVSLIITTLHGQFDALPTFLSVTALFLYTRRRFHLSALIIGCAIAFKPFPVLLLPLLLWRLSAKWQRVEYALTAAAPTAVLLLPFLIYAPTAVFDQLFGYRGVALLGFLIPIRSIYVLLTHEHFPVGLTYRLLGLSKWIFLAAYAVWTVQAARRRDSIMRWAAGVLALFYGLYAGISPQYLLWMLPFLILLSTRPLLWAFIYTGTATLALLGFYAYAVPATIQPLWPVPSWDPRWVYGAGGMIWWLSVLVLFGWLSISTEPAQSQISEKM